MIATTYDPESLSIVQLGLEDRRADLGSHIMYLVGRVVLSIAANTGAVALYREFSSRQDAAAAFQYVIDGGEK